MNSQPAFKALPTPAKELKLTEEQQEQVTPVLEKILEAFRTMRWVKNYHRKNASDGGCDSMSLGMVNRFEHGNGGRFGFYPSVNNTKYPSLLGLLTTLANLIDFPCTTFCINHNFQCTMHRDRVNEGESIIVGLGPYKGGEFIIKNDDEQHTRHHFDIRNKFFQFDGAFYLHGTTPFQGERYRIIMYTPATCKSKGEVANRCLKRPI